MITALGVTLLAAPLAACSTSKAGPSRGAASATAAADSATASASVGPQVQRVVDGVAANIAEHWPYMNTVWPGMDYTRHVLVLLKIDEQLAPQTAWAIDTKGARVLKAEEYKDLPVSAFMSYE